MKPRFFSVLFMAAFLVACQRNEEDNVAATEPPPPAPVVLQDFLPLPVESVNQSFTQEKCKKNCAEVKASLLKFSSDEVLTTELEKALVKLAQTGAATSDVDTMSAFAATFLKQSRAGYSAVLKADTKYQAGPLLVLELHTSVFTGGAHGQPATRYLNYDRRSGKFLTIDDVVQDGKRPLLLQKQKAAVLAWQKQQGIGSESWPFVESSNFALDKDGLRFKYQAYDIASYAMGEPEILLPYGELQDVLKPDFLLAAATGRAK